MQAFTTHRGLVTLLDRANVDTDQIIAKQFLKSIKRTGFGEHLFFDWRYDAEGKPNQDFELNEPRYQGASILVARNNFGCGSSREHAVWAVLQYGILVVIAPYRDTDNGRVPGFADIFCNNSIKNGLLTVQLSESEVQEIFEITQANVGLEATVDLENCCITLHADSGEKSYTFEISEGVREYLLRGLDEIDLTLEHADDITAFESSHQTWRGSAA